MVVRVLAVALGCLMTGAPVATIACEASCTAREHATAGAGEHHSCHAPADADGPALATGAHACGHPIDSPNALDQSLRTVHAPGAAAVALFVTPRVAVASHVRVGGVDHGPPGIVTLAAQLRV